MTVPIITIFGGNDRLYLQSAAKLGATASLAKSLLRAQFVWADA
jgi:hypothetical protein